MGLGFFCSTSDNELTTNRKLRLRNLNENNVLRVFYSNLIDFIKLLNLSSDMGLTIFSLGSNFIPFASYPNFNENWFRGIERTLVNASQLILGFGVGVTMHPAQFIVLNSPNRNVVAKSLAEIKYHFWVLDTIGFGPDSVVVIHVGGVYGDKGRAVRNLYGVLEENKWLKRRLALENDERFYTVKEVLEIAESFDIPVVYDHYHHKLTPSSFSLDRLISTWRGRPLEVHISSASGEGRFGEHGDYVDPRDFVEAINMFLEDVKVDVILEAKKKEFAIVRLIEELKHREPRILDRLSVEKHIDENELKHLLMKYISMEFNLEEFVSTSRDH